MLLVEDDDGDAFLVQELLREAGVEIVVVRVASLAEAEAAAPRDADCVLLDLGLPDAEGMQGLARMLEVAPGTALIVLTGLVDEHRGIEAVGAGAQDYLVKGAIDGQLLSRAIRYAVERKRADESVRRLYASEVRAAENARLERGLLPQALVSERVSVKATYRPGAEQAVLGGDFYDVVETPDGSIYAVIGDVAGHGPDEAALGVCLRIAWRTLVLSGADPDSVLPSMHAVLTSERAHDEVFATVAMVRVRAGEGQASFWLAGHPAPLVLDDDALCFAPDGSSGLALGIVDGVRWGAVDRPVSPTTRLVLFTDGLIEGLDGAGGRDRLGEDGLCGVVTGFVAQGLEGAALVDAVLGEVTRRNGGELTDDVAVMLLSWDGR